MNVVVDTNVVVSGIFWPGEARRCLALWAKKRFRLSITREILNEYAEVARRIAAAYPQVNPAPWLAWIESKAQLVDPAPLGKQRSVDPKGDPFLACGIASNAKVIVTMDKHLLALGKPFGIEILTPRRFLLRFK